MRKLPSTVSRAESAITLRGLGVLAVFGFTVLTAIGAQIRIPLPGTPVPFTLQTVFVLMSGVCLGPRLGFASQALYLAIGALGVPIFAHAAAGFEYMTGATAGYLAGFLLAPVAVGAIANRQTGFLRIATAVFTGTLVVFGCGVVWLTLSVTSGDVLLAIEIGLVPFVLAAALKWLLAVAACKTAGPLWCRKR